MTEKGLRESENNFLRKLKDLLITPETYSFDALWSQRKKRGAKPLITDLVIPSEEKICLGLREYHEYLGNYFYVLGMFSQKESTYNPVGYLVAERIGQGRSLVSNTADKSTFLQFKHDPIFTPLIESIRGGMTFVVEDDFQNHGLGTKMIEAMLDISQKINTPELILANVSGYVHRLGDTLAEKGKIEYRWVESNGTMYIKKKV